MIGHHPTEPRSGYSCLSDRQRQTQVILLLLFHVRFTGCRSLARLVTWPQSRDYDQNLAQDHCISSHAKYPGPQSVIPDILDIQFADILDIYATLPDELVIVGDFNFHFDINTDVHVRRFRDLLYSHGMTQYVEVATHQEGHILDLIIARTYSCVVDTVVADLIPDHCAVHCRIAMRKPPFRRELKTYRKMKATNLTSFSTDIENSCLIHKA